MVAEEALMGVESGGIGVVVVDHRTKQMRLPDRGAEQL
jgi:hypothetical protein